MVLPPNLEHIRAEFELAQEENDPNAKLHAAQEGCALVAEFLRNPELSAALREIATGLRNSYIRSLRVQLFTMTEIELSQWFSYARFLVIDCPDPLAEALALDEQLRKAFNDFAVLWASVDLRRRSH